MTLKNISQDQLEDLNTMLRSIGRSSDEFDVSVGPTTLVDYTDQPRPVGTITPILVKCRSTGIERIYQLASSQSYSPYVRWVADLQQDIANGVF